MRQKVTVVGAGNVGATVAQRIFEGGYADVVLIDIVEGLPQGKALDMLESAPIVGSDAKIEGTTDYGLSRDSDVVVITSGVPRKPGMTRDDLLFTNMDIVGSVTRNIMENPPDSIIITVTNPLDAMTQHALEVSQLSRDRVVGMAGILDTARFRSFLAAELAVSVEDVHAYVLGGHGDTMVPLIESTNIGGVPINQMIPPTRLDEIVQRTRDGGGEIVSLLKTGSAFYAPSAAAVQMVESILFDKNQILPCCVKLEQEYGINGLCVGVPVKLGSNGIEEVIELKLSEDETNALIKSSEAVQELLHVMNARSTG